MDSNEQGPDPDHLVSKTLEAGDDPKSGEVASTIKTPRPSQYRTYTRQELAKSMPKIVETFVEKAKEGSVSHLALLTKIGGFDLRPVPAPIKRRGKSFARRLLDDLRKSQSTGTTNETGTNS